MARTAKPSQVYRVLRRLGYRFVRQTGSHQHWEKPGQVWHVTVPDHGNRDLHSGTFRSILRQMGVSTDRFFGLLG